MKNKTIDFYNKNAKKWSRDHANKDSYRDRIVSEFKEILPNGKILEIGCGPGIDARKLMDNGFEYVGTDASIEFVKVAEGLNPGIKFLEMSVEELDFPEKEFDGFWSSATLLHIHKDKINGVLDKIRNVCKPGSKGLITLKRGTGEGEEKETGRWFSFYEKEEFEKILKQNRMKVVKFEVIKDFREGRPDWLVFFVKIGL